MSPSPSSTKGKAEPSLSAPSPARLKRTRSGRAPGSDWTPEASTGSSRASHVCIAAHDFRADRGEGEEFRTLEFTRDFLRECGFTLLTRDDDPRYYVPYHVHGYRE